MNLIVKVNLPFIDGLEVAKVSGNIKQGVSVAFNYMSTVHGEVGVRLGDAGQVSQNLDAVLYWDFFAFGSGYKSRLKLLDVVSHVDSEWHLMHHTEEKHS